MNSIVRTKGAITKQMFAYRSIYDSKTPGGFEGVSWHRAAALSLKKGDNYVHY